MKALGEGRRKRLPHMLRGVMMVVSGGSQNFLGFRWIEPMLSLAPRSWKRKLALNILDLSPHYLYRRADNSGLPRATYLEYEFRRNRESREAIIGSLVAPHLAGSETVLDYGCGPGFLAHAASRHAGSIHGCDISTGAIACAEVVHAAHNVKYCALERGRIPLGNSTIDLLYTFAVIQHVTDEVFRQILAEWRRVLKPGGKVLCHVMLDGEGWRSESDWRADRSVRGRARWMFGMHCFSRVREVFGEMVTESGFSVPEIGYISGSALKGDLCGEPLCVFEKRRDC